MKRKSSKHSKTRRRVAISSTGGRKRTRKTQPSPAAVFEAQLSRRLGSAASRQALERKLLRAGLSEAEAVVAMNDILLRGLSYDRSVRLAFLNRGLVGEIVAAAKALSQEL